jgi:hypothetical protein
MESKPDTFELVRRIFGKEYEVMPEPSITLSEMFEFISWKESNHINETPEGWFIFEVSSWVKIGNNIDLWNKFKERP